MKFNIKLNGVTVSKDIPNAWHLTTFRQFFGLAKAGSDTNKMIEVFTGIAPETLKKAQIKNFEVLLSCLSFISRDMNLIIPETILGYSVPKNLEDEAAARYGDVQEIIKKFERINPEDTKEQKEAKNTNNLQYYPLIVATYITPSPYDHRQADQLAERLWDAPCQEVMAIGNFTLARLVASKSGMLSNFPPGDTRLSRLRRVTINWLTRLDFSIRYGIWKNQLPSPVKRYLNGR